MKKLLLITGAIMVLFACQKQELNENSVDKWNGYESYYKAGEVYKNLIVGRNEIAGTVTYGIDDDANFYATFTTNSDWLLEETYLFAGKWSDMPRSRHNDKKMFRFPKKTFHNPYVSTYTYRIPLINLPPCSYPGFIVSSYAELHPTNKCGKKKPSWGGWDRRHADETWGGYFIYFYNEPIVPHTLLYATEYDANNGNMNLYLVDVTSDNTELISSNPVGYDVSVDASAWDPASEYLGYAITANSSAQSELFINQLDETVPYSAGILDGVAKSATFYEGNFYYVDALTNEIKVVGFDKTTETWTITGTETVFSTIPAIITEVNDITMNLDGNTMYLVGTYNTNTVLVTLDVATDTYSTTDISLASDVQVAYGSDNELYVVSTIGTGSLVSSLDPTSGTSTQISDIDIGGGGGIISDLGRGPIQ